MKVIYTVETRDNKTGIVEHTTGNFIHISKNKARKICDALNWGSGFDGNTPRFFTVEAKSANN